MNELAHLYTKSTHDHLKPLFANWEPGRPIKMGDYGIMSDYSFCHLGNIADLGITFKVRADHSPDQKSFSSEGSTNIQLNAKGEAYAKATLEIGFAKKGAVFFNAAECRHSMIEDKPALGRRVMELHQSKTWEQAWAVVTDVVESKATTIVVSGADTSSILLEASADIASIDLSNASVSLSLRSERNLGFKTVAEKGLVPLIGLCKIQRPFLILGKKFNPLLWRGTPSDAELPDDGEGSPEELFFGQLH